MTTETKPNELDPYWMPFTANRAFKRAPRMIVGAEGMHYVTPDGRRVIDATSGLYCVNAGHGRRRIVEAIQRQAATLDYSPAFQFGHPGAFQLASRIALLAPGDLDRVFFASSGSEAVDTALKIALAYWRARGQGQRTRFIGRERGYHGVGFGGISVGGMVNNRRAFGAQLLAVDHLQTTYNREKQAFSIGEPEWGGELAGELERLIAFHDASTIAAVIVEPVAGSTGCLPPPKGYLERLRAITAAHGIPLILDEVITAFGRLGHAFAAERYGVMPDMIAFAKGITNGAVPLSGVVVRTGIYDALMQGPDHVSAEARPLPGIVPEARPLHEVELFHGYTNSGHPLAVAAALAALDVYREEDLFQRARDHEAGFAERMMSLRHSPHVADIRPIGMMCGIDLASRPGAAGVRGSEVTARAFHDHDMYVRVAGDTIVVAPPLIASADDLDAIRDRLGRTLAAIG